jgi:hypothetical protein
MQQRIVPSATPQCVGCVSAGTFSRTAGLRPRGRRGTVSRSSTGFGLSSGSTRMSSRTPPPSSMMVAEATLSSVTGHKHPGNALRAGEDERLAKDLGGLPASTMWGQHAIANLAPEVGEEVIQLVTDRRTSDQLAANVGRQERRWTQPGGSSRPCRISRSRCRYAA